VRRKGHEVRGLQSRGQQWRRTQVDVDGRRGGVQRVRDHFDAVELGPDRVRVLLQGSKVRRRVPKDVDALTLSGEQGQRWRNRKMMRW
jgi:hypothetical protein